MINLRDDVPNRRKIPLKNNYRKYREELESDFNQRCGYCDDSSEFAERISFQIDHFAPKSKFPKLKNCYGNLVFACHICNRNKHDHWVGNDPSVPKNGQEGFIDPCLEEYDTHLSRDTKGRIFSKTPLGEYMVMRLSLSDVRHKYLWRARRFRKLRTDTKKELNELRCSELNQDDKDKKIEILETIQHYTEEIEKYEGLAQKNN